MNPFCHQAASLEISSAIYFAIASHVCMYIALIFYSFGWDWQYIFYLIFFLSKTFLNVIIDYLTGNENPGVMVEGQTFTIGEHDFNFANMLGLI